MTNDDQTTTNAALAVARKLLKAGAAVIASPRESESAGKSLAVFRASETTSGVVAVYDDRDRFAGVVAGLAPTEEGKHLASNGDALTLVSWNGTDDALNAKVRAVVGALNASAGAT